MAGARVEVTEMDFSTMILTMYLADDDGPVADERVLGIAVEESLLAGSLGFNPWFTEHHFRGPWHSNPMQFAAYIAPQLPADRYLGFGVLSTPFYHPVRLVESMNLLDQLTKGHAMFGLGSGFPGKEPVGLGLEREYHKSGQAARDQMDVMQRLWQFIRSKRRRGAAISSAAWSQHPTVNVTRRSSARPRAMRRWSTPPKTAGRRSSACSVPNRR
jgi:alkanesulfonate monooxygenase SsuD/methylene tetrahydromethanopterin reductase-like flavin-dependent oxidoreductase (luciferase family)